MKKYIIINGTMGAGKSITGRRTAELLGRAAFIEGDFVIEMFPHIDYNETKSMQKDNILHMSGNYYNFDKCDSIVLSWIMSENTVKEIISGLSDFNFQIYNFVLTCSEETLTNRWKKDNINDWRNDENLNMAINMLDDFNKRTDCILIDTSDLSVDKVVEKIIRRIHTF
ncbi:MAG: AAA family ATPase [Oscillospiraceae bacterium]|nr:AAA family ATPase [Oscillospiraceae bacterium]